MRARRDPFRLEDLWKKSGHSLSSVLFSIISASIILQQTPYCLVVVLYVTSFGALNVLWQCYLYKCVSGSCFSMIKRNM